MASSLREEDGLCSHGRLGELGEHYTRHTRLKIIKSKKVFVKNIIYLKIKIKNKNRKEGNENYQNYQIVNQITYCYRRGAADMQTFFLSMFVKKIRILLMIC